VEVKLSIHTVNCVCVCVCVHTGVQLISKLKHIWTSSAAMQLFYPLCFYPAVFFWHFVLSFLQRKVWCLFHYFNCTSLTLHKLGSVCNRDAAFHVYHQLRVLALVEECEV
jgi:hypothetical protein